MLSQYFPCPQTYFFEVATHLDDPATDAFIHVMYDYTVFMGDLAYNYLALEANATHGRFLPDRFGYSPPPEYTYDNIGHLSPSPGSVTSPGATGGPFLFSPSPSPSPSQASILEYHQLSPSPSHTPEPSCRGATPVFNHIRGKWCCSVCDKTFRGKWECRRHIGIIGKRAMCLACGGILTRRGDSLKRHFKRYCKGDVGNIRFEDAFTEV